MKLNPRDKRSLYRLQNEQSHFMQELQHSLIQQPNKTIQIGPQQFEQIYAKKKILSDTIDSYHEKNKFSKNDINKAKQRISMISQLNDKANRHSILMRNQIGKINEAHMMSKILMMEKIVRLEKENQSIEKKRMNYFKTRQEKEAINYKSRFMVQNKRRNRQQSLMQTREARSLIEQGNYQTLEQNRSRADRVRSEKKRRKQKLQRYEKFKQDQAKRNYISKTQKLIEKLKDKEKQLETLFIEQAKQQKHFQTTQKVTKQYLQSMFPTSTHSQDMSMVFPTQTN